MSNVISKEDIIRGIENTNNHDFVVNVPNERSFVKFSFSSQEGFARFEAVKETQDILRRVIESTGGNMSTELINAYEGLNSVMERIKDLELSLIKFGR